MTLHTRILDAYSAGCGAPRASADTGGGYIAEEEPMLPLSSLPSALASLGVHGDLYDEIYETLQDSAVMATNSTRSGRARKAKAIPKDAFVEALSEALKDVPESALAVDLNRADEDDSDDYEAGGEDAVDDVSDDDVVADLSEEEEDIIRPVRHRLSTAQRDRAAFLYQLVLERIPLVPPKALKEHVPDRNLVREVTPNEVNTRRIGIDELSFALQCLGEPMALKEMNEMLEVATPGASERSMGLNEEQEDNDTEPSHREKPAKTHHHAHKTSESHRVASRDAAHAHKDTRKSANVWEERRRQQQRCTGARSDDVTEEPTAQLATELDDAWLTRINILNGGEHLKKHGHEKRVSPAPGAFCSGSAPAYLEHSVFPFPIPFLTPKDGSFSPLRPDDAHRVQAPSSLPGYMSMPFAQVYVPYALGEGQGIMPVMVPVWDTNGVPVMPLTSPVSSFIPMPLDSPATAHQLLSQVEFYFSTKNLEVDTYLRQQMDRNGYVSLDVVSKFNRVRHILAAAAAVSKEGYIKIDDMSEMHALQRALSLSTVLELNPDKTHVRRRDGWQYYIGA
ncbi:hypothetical protein MCUN1_000422 [Malassezia cuniculi]|uniref:HTH La-type RNA-binding domain-containing protein n=1 Tax=Malassezia cuniculi TaxID=948313 RepID=A0AAF0ERG9_9BASI|nr:hypothetical protein MCUN1_000422 [Malassezia cuniculi]